jgi:Ribbon-helix-helix protein, copG family
MRTTVNLEPDVAAAVDRLRRREGLGVSEALNRLARAGLVEQPRRKRFKQPTADLGAMVDISNVAEVLDLIEGPEHR